MHQCRVPSARAGDGLDGVHIVVTTTIAIGGNGRGAGPRMTAPFTALYSLPWQGQVITPFAFESTVQPWWVQTAEKALSTPVCAHQHDFVGRQDQASLGRYLVYRYEVTAGRGGRAVTVGPRG